MRPPTNISTKSEPDTLKNGTRFARNRFGEQGLPVPGGPTNRTPCGILPPSFGILRVFEEVDDFFDFLFGFVTAGPSLKFISSRCRLADGRGIYHRHHAVLPPFILTHHENHSPTSNKIGSSETGFCQKLAPSIWRPVTLTLFSSSVPTSASSLSATKVFGPIVRCNGQFVTLDFPLL